MTGIRLWTFTSQQFLQNHELFLEQVLPYRSITCHPNIESVHSLIPYWYLVCLTISYHTAYQNCNRIVPIRRPLPRQRTLLGQYKFKSFYEIKYKRQHVHILTISQKNLEIKIKFNTKNPIVSCFHLLIFQITILWNHTIFTNVLLELGIWNELALTPKLIQSIVNKQHVSWRTEVMHEGEIIMTLVLP